MGLGSFTKGLTKTVTKATGGILDLGGSLLSTYAGYQGEKAAANVERMNADQLEQEASRIREEGLQNALRGRHNQAQAVSDAALARNGRNVTSEGSALNAELSVMEQAEIGIQDLLAKTENDARTMDYQAAVKRYEASQRKKKSKWGSLGKVVGSVGKVAGSSLGGILGSSK